MDDARFGDELHTLFRDINFSIGRAVRAAFEPLGITRNQSTVLMAASGGGGAVPVVELCEKMHTPASNVTNICNRLEAGSYIVKERGSDDRRKVTVRLTERGKSLVDSIRLSHGRITTLVTANASDDERETIVKGLRLFDALLKRNLERLEREMVKD